MRKILAIVGIMAMLFSACGSEKTGSDNNENGENGEKTELKTQTISEVLAPKAFLEKLKATEGAQLIDVRTPEEVAAGALEGAVNLNFYDADFKDKLSKLDKNKPVFVYCRSGGRSGKCSAMCKEMGFKEVYDMQGGWELYSSTK